MDEKVKIKGNTVSERECVCVEKEVLKKGENWSNTEKGCKREKYYDVGAEQKDYNNKKREKKQNNHIKEKIKKNVEMHKNKTLKKWRRKKIRKRIRQR